MIIVRAIFLALFLLVSANSFSSSHSLGEWCASENYGSPQWNLLQILIGDKNTVLNLPRSSAIRRDCDVIVPFLEKVSKVRLNFNEVSQVSLDFSPLRLLPKLRELEILNFPKAFLNLESLNGLTLEKLTLKNIGLENLDFLRDLTVTNLSFEQNPLYSLRNITRAKGVKSLTLSGTAVKDLRILASFRLETLNIVGLNVPVVLGLEYLSYYLAHLDIRNTVLSNPKLIKRMKRLKTLKATGDNSPLDMSELTNLEELYLKDFSEGGLIFPENMEKTHTLTATRCDLSQISFLKSTPALKELDLSFNRINDLSPLWDENFPALTYLQLSGNPILNVSPLSELSALETLRLFRTPIQRGQVPKTEENCPTNTGPEVLRIFCAN